MIRSVFPCVCARDIDACRDFYTSILGLEVIFESGWYTALAHRDRPELQLAFVLSGHPTVPDGFGGPAHGVLVTVEVDDVDRVHEQATHLGHRPELDLCSERFGQRHFMLRDPAGLLLDVVQLIPPAPSFLREVARWRRSRSGGQET